MSVQEVVIPFYVASYYIKWVTTFWTYCINNETNSELNFLNVVGRTDTVPLVATASSMPNTVEPSFKKKTFFTT